MSQKTITTDKKHITINKPKKIMYPIDFVPTRQSVPVSINGVTFNVLT